MKLIIRSSQVVDRPQTTYDIARNVVAISLAFMISSTAYSGTINLQSSINADAGLGTLALGISCAGFVVSNMFLPVLLIKWIGTKWTICISFLAYTPYYAAQLYPNFYTLIPTAWIMGFGGASLWCAKSAYLCAASENHKNISNISLDILLSRFFGIFFMIYQLNQVFGNLISSLVLSLGDNEAAVTAVNDSIIPTLCGANYFPSTDADKALQVQPKERIQIIAGIFIGCTIIASLIVAIVVDPIQSNQDNKNTSMNGSVMTRTLKVLIDPKQILLIFFNIFTGMQQAYFAADFTASFVSCAIGVGIVGFVMMTYGLVDAIGSVTVGQLAKKVGRLPLMIAAFVTHSFILVFLLSWSPQSNQKFVVYILACLWGLCDSVWMVQSSVFYGIIFADRKEAAFSSIRFYESIGFVIAYFISPYLRTNVKTYILLLTMVIGVVLYFVLEYKEKKSISLNPTPQLNSPNMELDFCDQVTQNKKSKSSMSDGDTVL